jgi:phage terminase large subunit-like protein
VADRRHLRLVDGGGKPGRGPGRPAKSLQEHVRAGTFRRRIHEMLLVDDELVAEPELRKLQQRYRRLKLEHKRKDVALDFERIARGTAPERAEEAATEFQATIRRLGKPGTGKFAIRFFEEFYVWDDGSSWRLEPEQRAFLEDLYKRDRQRRRVYQEILLGLPRGAGKTPTASGVGTMSLATSDVRITVKQAAGSKLQAAIGTGYSSNWVDDNDLLAKWLEARASSVVRRDGRGSYNVVSSDGRLAHGLHGRLVAIADELWLYKSAAEEQAYVALESTLHKDPESFLLAISTAGYSKRSLLGRKYRRGLACPHIETRREGFLTIGRDPDAGFLMWWYGMPDGYELDLEDDKAVLRALKLANWRSGVDHRLQLRSLRRAMNGEIDEDDDVQDVFEWLRLCLNFWTSVKGSWLRPGAWRALADATVTIPRAADVYVAVDAAHSYDTTAVAWSWFSPELQKTVTRCRIFSVRDQAPAHVHVDDFYDAKGNEHVAEKFIHELADVHGLRVREVVGDPNYFGGELARLGERFLTAPIYPQSNDMRDYVQRFYRDVHAGRIVTDGDHIVTEHVQRRLLDDQETQPVRADGRRHRDDHRQRPSAAR